MNSFEKTLGAHGIVLRRAATEILQVNLGSLCNLACSHCHVNAGPARKEIMDSETLGRVLDWFEASEIPTIDFTGGAPEMNPGFRAAVERVRAMTPRRRIVDRCNLTILLEPGHESLAEFLAGNEVEIVASMPCYRPENVNEQRGDGVFDSSIRALQMLNELGYGRSQTLPLHLVYNPNGAFLPGPQSELEADYKREMAEHFGIVFDSLFTITNMAISRFASWLKNKGELDAYNELLVSAFNPATVDGLMCRDTLSVDWLGGVHDCDFNQMLDLPLGNGGRRRLWDVDADSLAGTGIRTANHCFGCTAGAGSSCGGAIKEKGAELAKG